MDLHEAYGASVALMITALHRGVGLRVPGADDMLLYQPRHAMAYDVGH